MTKFEELQDRVKKLKLLLDDPMPDGVMWCKHYAEHMKFISDYWMEN
jgi:hypothetical protein